MERSRRTSAILRGLNAASISPQGSSRPSSSAGGRLSCRSMLLLALASLLLLSLLSFYGSGRLLRGDAGHGVVRCAPEDRDPMLFHLKTALQVGYSGGHWFHVAEAFMTQHALLPPERKASSSLTFFSIDRPGFIREMNGVTKLFVLLGLYNPRTQFAPQFAQFMHIHPSYVAWEKLRVGDGISIPGSHVLEAEVSMARRTVVMLPSHSYSVSVFLRVTPWTLGSASPSQRAFKSTGSASDSSGPSEVRGLLRSEDTGSQNLPM